MGNRGTLYFFILISLSTIPHGLEIDWQFFLFACSLYCTILVLLFQELFKPSFHNALELKRELTLIAAFIPWLIYTCLQLAQFQIVSINEGSLISYNNILRGNQIGSISTHATSIELLKYISYISIFGFSLLIVRSKCRLLNACRIFFGSSLCIAIYSLFNYFTKGQLNLISSIPPWTIGWDKATHGTFSYQNHYAAFLILTIPIGVGLIVENYRQNNRRYGAKRLMNILLSPIGFYAFSIVVMCTSLILTSSRGGNTVFIFGVMLTVITVILKENKLSIRSKLAKVLKWFVVGATLCLIFVISGLADSLVNRITDRGFEPNGRDIMRQTAYQIIEQKTLFGTGAGTYPLIQHKYKSPELGTSKMSKHAHNDYLELLANQGVIGFTLLALPILYLVYFLFRSLSYNRQSSLYGMKAAIFCSTITLLIHSLADFNFQLPAIAIYFFALIAIALKCDKVSNNKKIKALTASSI